MRHRWVFSGVVLFLLVFLAVISTRQRVPAQQSAAPATPTMQASPTSPSPETGERVLGERALGGEQPFVDTVIDGDTVRLADGRVVRLIGIDAPETGHRRPHECFADEATNRARELLTGKGVTLEKDVSETDRYGRLLRYVYVGERLVNDALVREGYAVAYAYPPDVRHADQLRQAEHEARAATRGLWGSACATASRTLADDKNCSDFLTRAAAQEFFVSHGGPQNDPYKLDVDRDGVACESLP